MLETGKYYRVSTHVGVATAYTRYIPIDEIVYCTHAPKPNSWDTWYVHDLRRAGEEYKICLKPDLLWPEASVQEIEDFQELEGDLPIENRIHSGTFAYFGGDPEIFTLHGDGSVLPAWEFLPHKDAAKSTNVHNNTGPLKCFWDGFQAEFTLAPARCLAWTVDSIQKGLQTVLTSARKLDPLATLTHECVIDADQGILDTAAQEHVQFGCAPSQNIYDERPLDIGNSRTCPFRFAGGHIHHEVSAELKTPEFVRRFVKLQDSLVGVCMTLLLRGLERPERRMFYGKAGEYRLPSHGIEYRTLSSAMYIHPAVTMAGYELSRIAHKLSQVGGEKAWDASESEVRDCLNHLDLDLAEKILSRNSKILQGIGKILGMPKLPTFLTKGYLEFGERDMIKNWYLTSRWTFHSDGPGVNLGRFLSTHVK